MLASIASQKEKKVGFAEERAIKKQNASWKHRTDRALLELEMSSKFYVKPKYKKQAKAKKKSQYAIKGTNHLHKNKNTNGLLEGEVEVDIDVDSDFKGLDFSTYVISNTKKNDKNKVEESDNNENSKEKGDSNQAETKGGINGTNAATTVDMNGANAGNDEKQKQQNEKLKKKIIKEMFARILDRTHIEVAKRKLLAAFEEKKKVKVEEALSDLRKQVENDLMKQMKDQQDVFKARVYEFRRNIKDMRAKIKYAEESAINYGLLSVRALVDHGANLQEPGLFNVTPLQYAEMKDKLELAKFIRSEQTRLDRAMGKESDIARWMRLEAARKAKEALKKDKARKKLEEKMRREAIAEKKLKEQIANIETNYEPVIGSKILVNDASSDFNNVDIETTTKNIESSAYVISNTADAKK